MVRRRSGVGPKASATDPTDGLELPAGSAAPGRPYVVVFSGDAAKSFMLPSSGETLVGRAEHCAIALEDSAVSRVHLRIARSAAGTLEASDAGSQNGSTVNGQRLTSPRALRSGDVIEMGSTALVFHDPSPGSQSDLPPEPAHARIVDAGATKMLVADPAMVRLTDLLSRIARSELPVLVVGETGTGKELAAAAVHAASPRRERAFLPINCAAVQDSIFESELFGFERGAFTGAVQGKPGLLEVATGGTVFLDEVGELSAGSQAKLLRALDVKKVIRVGGLEERPIDVRIVAATNRDLAREVDAGRFRQDLYFRLSGATLWLPPLRDRPRELEMLASAFLAEACRRLGRDTPALSRSFVERLRAHPFPGNVRELRNVIEYVAATSRPGEALVTAHLDDRLTPSPPRKEQAPPRSERETFRPIEEEVRELEKRRMAAALLAANGNQRRAAELIGMPLRTFVTKLKEYDLRDKTRRDP